MLKWTSKALTDLARLCEFLAPKTSTSGDQNFHYNAIVGLNLTGIDLSAL